MEPRTATSMLALACSLATGACEAVPGSLQHFAAQDGGAGSGGGDAGAGGDGDAGEGGGGAGGTVDHGRALHGALAYRAADHSVKILEPGQAPRVVRPYSLAFAWSPDATRLAIGVRSEIDVIRADDGELERTIPVPNLCACADRLTAVAWGPQDRLAFTHFVRDGVPGVFQVAPDGSAMSLILEGFSGPQWARDGTLVAVDGRHVHVQRADGSSLSVDEIRTPVASLGPDGRHLLLGSGSLFSLVDLDGEVPSLDVRAGAGASWSWDSTEYCTARLGAVHVMRLGDIETPDVARGDTCVIAPDGKVLALTDRPKPGEALGEAALFDMATSIQDPLEVGAVDFAWAPPCASPLSVSASETGGVPPTR